MKKLKSIFCLGCLLASFGCGRNNPPQDDTKAPEKKPPTPLQEVTETVTGIRAIRTGEEIKREIRDLEERQRQLLEQAEGEDF